VECAHVLRINFGEIVVDGNDIYETVRRTYPLPVAAQQPAAPVA